MNLQNPLNKLLSSSNFNGFFADRIISKLERNNLDITQDIYQDIVNWLSEHFRASVIIKKHHDG